MKERYHNSPRRRSTPRVCPVCGEDVPPKASACPDCGADHRTGWDTEAGGYDGLDLPGESDFNYDEFVQVEFGGGKKRDGLRPLWWYTALALFCLGLAALIFWGFTLY